MKASSRATSVQMEAVAARAARPAETRNGPWVGPNLVWLGTLFFTSLLILRAVDFWVFTLDDAFITLRYARHLAHGDGPSWNPGAARAEGYTSFLWMLVLAAGELVRLDGPWFAKASGVVFASASFFSAAFLVRRSACAQRMPTHACFVAVATVLALFISYWPLSLHAISGMETTLSCLVLTVFFYFSVERQLDPDNQTVCRRLAISALACCLTRPEAIVPCGVTLLTHLATSNRQRQSSLLSGSARWLAAPFALYQLARWLHFGLLFPLSFYVKATGQPLFVGLPGVLDFFAPFVSQQPWWALLILLGGLSHWRILLPGILGAASFAIFFVFPEHIMAFEGRYLLPVFPFMAALAGLGLARIGAWVARSQHQRTPHLSLTLVTLCVLAALPLPRDRAARAQRWLDYGRSLQAAHVALAHDLARASPSERGRVALLDVGAVGYYADWYTIDTFGLNDAHVALTRRADINYVMEERPDLLIVVSAEPGDYKGVFPWETPLYEAAQQREYQTLCNYRFQADYYLRVLARPGSSIAGTAICSSGLPIAEQGRP